MESKKVFLQLEQVLKKKYASEEAAAIAFRILDLEFQINKLDFLLNKPIKLPPNWSQLLTQLESGKPFQYVFQKEYFRDLLFELNQDTLIPRPETEELVDLVIEFLKQKSKPGRVLDIGTGSGCIPISLKKEVPTADIYAWDIAPLAILQAQKNAKQLNEQVYFEVQDVFQWMSRSETWDVIISNPPYVLEQEKEGMEAHVLEYEPHLAIFVPNENPLKYYIEITKMAKNRLNEGGCLFFEINRDYGNEVVNLLEKEQFKQVKLHIDFRGNKRFVSGQI